MTNRLTSGLAFVALAAYGLLLSGCSKPADEARRFQVSGAVTYDGKPLPAGSITFEPDAAAGNSGPSSTASIVDGRYDSGSNDGAVKGKQIVRIYPPSLPSEADTSGIVQFPPFETQATIPEEASVHDFEIPAN